jgi:DNA-directed RNA polymerase subunit M/transcription elongation factor TFIIS
MKIIPPNPTDKLCTSCKSWKPLSYFGKHTRRKDGLRGNCKECERKLLKEYSKKRRGIDTQYGNHNIKIIRKSTRIALRQFLYRENIFEVSRWYSNRLMKKYGMTLDDYHSMLESQNFSCKICGSNKKFYRLAVDHCHKTGKVRGILCQGCNGFLGHARDDVSFLQKMICYIQDNQ